MSPYYDALPVSLVPFHYDLYVRAIDIAKETFKGSVTIHLKVDTPTSELHLHYRDLTVYQEKVSVSSDSGPVEVVGLEEFKAKEYFVVKFNRELTQGTVKVTLDYDAIIQTNMTGFYKSGYIEDGVEKFMLSTQFEATDARRTFPCLDEPLLKATFSVSLEIEKHLDALCNTPELNTELAGDYKVVTFQKTPVVSTYLVAWAVGEFEYLETFTEDLYLDNKPLPIRIYTSKGYLQNAKFALEITPKIVDFFSKKFEIKYPLPKLDLIAVHSYSHNAMENWGLITYRSTALLYDEAKSDPSYQKQVAYVVAHEVAHQWFGDLVTMKWWDELWLNEGFATWAGYAAVDYLFPQWDFISVFISESLQEALVLDGLTSSHPIKVPVRDALEIDELFDDISYRKGGSTILMLSNYLGLDVFFKGVAKYLNENKYGNATSEDLWNAISDVSELPINEMMNHWIYDIGFPVINVDLSNSTLKVSQSRFLTSGKADDNVNWWVPLNISTGPGENDVLKSNGTNYILHEKQLEIGTTFSENSFFKLNKDTNGFYRVNYSGSTLNNNILPHFDKFSVKDKIGIIGDICAIAKSGDAETTTTTVLQLVQSIAIDKDLGDDYVVWLELGAAIQSLLIVFSGKDHELTQGLNNFVQKVYQKLAVAYISDSSSELTFSQRKLRSEILTKAGLLGVPEAQKYALRIFEEWKHGKTFDPSLRLFVFGSVAASNAITEENYQAILKEVTNPSSLSSREVALESLGHLSDEKLVSSLLKHLLDINIIPVMDSHFLGIPLSENAAARDQFWEFFAANYDEFYRLLSSNMVILDRFVKKCLKNYQTHEKYDQIKSFFSNKNIHGFERSYKQALDSVKINASWYDRDYDQVKTWLEKNSYL